MFKENLDKNIFFIFIILKQENIIGKKNFFQEFKEEKFKSLWWQQKFFIKFYIRRI